MRLHYQFSLCLAFLLIVVVPILASFLFFQSFLKNAAEGEFHSQAEKVARGITAGIGRRSEDLLDLARTYARDPAAAAALRDGDRSRLEKRLIELFPYSDLDLLEAGDASGTVMARAHRPGDRGEDKSGQAIIRNALRGTAGADIERGGSGIALRAVSPVPGPDGRTIGTLMTGALLDQGFFLAYKTITGFDLALFGGAALIASTAGGTAGWTPPSPPRPAGTVERIVFSPGGEEAWGAYIPIYHATGETFGGLLIWQKTSAILRPLRLNRLSLTFTFAVALVLGIGLTVFLSRNFSRPLKTILPLMDRVSRGEMAVRIPDFRWVEFSDLAGHFRHMLGELAKSQERIARTGRQLLVAGKLAVLGRVTAELAHEIRNPLNSIEINLRLLTDDLKADGKPAGEKIERLCAEVGRLKATVRDFVEAGGEITLRREPLDLAGEMRAILDLVRPQIDLLGIRLETDLRSLPPVPADRNRFHQIILNILLNACQSMSPGGILSVRNEAGEGKQTIVIRDTGAGIEPEERERIFDFPFTTKADGTGCGLAYALRVVQAHGGEFDLDSAPGAGTEARISFPRK